MDAIMKAFEKLEKKQERLKAEASGTKVDKNIKKGPEPKSKKVKLLSPFPIVVELIYRYFFFGNKLSKKINNTVEKADMRLFLLVCINLPHVCGNALYYQLFFLYPNSFLSSLF